jgi:hypothetical protein
MSGYTVQPINLHSPEESELQKEKIDTVIRFAMICLRFKRKYHEINGSAFFIKQFVPGPNRHARISSFVCNASSYVTYSFL